MKGESRKAIRALKRKQSDEQPLAIKSTEMPSLSSGLAMRSVNYAKGAVRLSEFYGVGAPLPSSEGKLPRPPSFALRWQGMMELDSDHGMSIICGILMDADLWILKPDRREELLSQVKTRLNENMLAMISESLRPPAIEEGEDDIRDVIIVGLWAERFAEPLSDLWLAAMAYHAYYAERNDFAFGYLTAQLDQRRETEEDFLRGRKSVESGKVGAQIRAKRSHAETERVLRELKRLIAGGHSISRAASIAADGGIGSSASANRKLWDRHSKK
jgi:hypothetical protein